MAFPVGVNNIADLQLINQRREKELRIGFSDVDLADSVHTFSVQGFNSISLVISADGNALGTWSIRGSNDLRQPFLPLALETSSMSPSVVTGDFNPGVSQIYYTNITTKYIQIYRVTYNSSAVISFSILLSDRVYPPKAPNEYSSRNWNYVTPANGITTALTVIRAAASPVEAKYVSHIELKNSGTAGTEVTLTSNSTVIWRDYLGAGERISEKLYLKVGGSDVLNLNLSTTANVVVYAKVKGFLNVGS